MGREALGCRACGTVGGQAASDESTDKKAAVDSDVVLPAVWNVPARLAIFSGRWELLERMQAGLIGGGSRVAITALHGLGGVGKTQLAVEYVWRRAGDYNLVWWVDVEQVGLIPGQLATSAERLRLPCSQTAIGIAAELLNVLAHCSDWLLIFDNATTAIDLRPWRPASPAGHVLIISWSPAWGGLAVPIEVDVFTADEAVSFLMNRVPALVGNRNLTVALADELGWLPLALEQAASYIEATGAPPADYLSRFRSQQETMLERGEYLTYGGTVDICWTLTLEQLQATNPAAATLLRLAAFLGPDPIPLFWFRADLLDGALRASVASDAGDDVVAAVRRYGLARRSGNSIQLHRLVQPAIRAHLPVCRRGMVAEQVHDLLAAVDTTPNDPAGWLDWAARAAHVLAAPALHSAASPVEPVPRRYWSFQRRCLAPSCRNKTPQRFSLPGACSVGGCAE